MKTCWQIRQELANQEGNGATGKWLLDCAACRAFASGTSCWELEAGYPRCCAPVETTCDFCALYIEHRRQIAAMTQREGSSAETQRRQTTTMERMQATIPSMWADHHVMKVRDVLLQLPGVESVYASSAWKQVLVSFDPAKLSTAAVEEALASAGYPVGDGELPVMTAPGPHARDPKWELLGARVTRTNRADVEMSGEFRRY